MKKFVASFAFVSLALVGCSTSSLTVEEKAPVPESTMEFSGGMKEIDTAQSRISFTGKSSILNHEGKFNSYTAVVKLDDTEPANLEKASIVATIDLTSVETDAAGLDGHLQKADFFDIEQFPTATFTSRSIVAKGGNMYTVTGDLMVKGMTQNVTFDAEITNDYLLASYDFPRKEFGIGNDSYGEKLLEDTVPVEVKLVFKK